MSLTGTKLAIELTFNDKYIVFEMKISDQVLPQFLPISSVSYEGKGKTPFLFVPFQIPFTVIILTDNPDLIFFKSQYVPRKPKRICLMI